MRFVVAKQANGYRQGFWQVVDNVTHTSFASYFLEDDAEIWANKLNEACEECGCWHEANVDDLVWPCEEHSRVYRITRQVTIIARNTEEASAAAGLALSEDLPDQLFVGEDHFISEVNRVEVIE